MAAALIAIGYEDETTAAEAAEEVYRLAHDLVIAPDAVAVIMRDGQGQYQLTTNHHSVGIGATWGMFWGLLLAVMFFVPIFGMAVGTGLEDLMGKVEKSGIDSEFQERARNMVKPGTSALFLMVEWVAPDTAIEGLRQYGGTVLMWSLSDDARRRLQNELAGLRG